MKADKLWTMFAFAYFLNLAFYAPFDNNTFHRTIFIAPGLPDSAARSSVCSSCWPTDQARPSQKEEDEEKERRRRRMCIVFLNCSPDNAQSHIALELCWSSCLVGGKLKENINIEQFPPWNCPFLSPSTINVRATEPILFWRWIFDTFQFTAEGATVGQLATTWGQIRGRGWGTGVNVKGTGWKAPLFCLLLSS